VGKKKVSAGSGGPLDTPMQAGATQVRVLPLPVENLPLRVKQVCDLMLADSYRLCGSFVYDENLLLIFQ
jgi:hypothetical protein